MASFSEYNKKRKQSFAEYTENVLANPRDEIAPVKTTAQEKDDSSGGWFKKSKLWDDGYQFGDLTSALVSTAIVEGSHIAEGAANFVEGIYDLGVQGVAGVADFAGADDFADKARKHANKNAFSDAFDDFRLIDAPFNSLTENATLQDASFGGDFRNQVMEGVGGIIPILATGGIAGAAGASAGVATAITTGVTGASSMGSGIGEAYNDGATDGEAWTYGAIKGAVDAGTELIFGGLGKSINALGFGKGMSSLDDIFAKKLSSKISNQFFKNAAEFGVKATGEGVEEVLAGLGTAAAKKLTYMSDEELAQLIKDENLLEQFAMGVIVSGIAQSGDFVSSTSKGRDFVSGLSKNEEAVVDAEYKNRVAEEEQNGTKLTQKQKNKIYEQVQADLKKGYISTDTIESVLGGETYKSYQDTIAEEDAAIKELESMLEGDELKAAIEDITNNSKRGALKTQLSEEVQNLLKQQKGKTAADSFLMESYNEKARRGQSYNADLSKYDEKQKAIIQKAIESGILNNTRRTHEFVDMIAKISADKGVSFDFANNEKIANSSFAVNGKTVNGYVDGDTVTLNIESKKQLEKVVGHEITHVLEGTEVYDVLQEMVFDYAAARKATDSKFNNEYHERLYNARQLYKDVDSYKGVDGFKKIKREVVADLVGDYLFTDPDFINHLSTKNRNLFQKMYDEIKYLCKIATAGTKEARQLEKVKKAFEEVYRADSKAQKNTADNSGAKYSLSGITDSGIEVYETSQETMNLTWEERKAKYLDVMKNEYRGRTAKFERNGHVYYAEFDQSSLRKPIYGDKRSSPNGTKALIKAGADGDIFDLVENSEYRRSRPNTKDHTDADYFDYFVKTVQIDGKVFDLVADVEKKYGGDGGYVYTLALTDNKRIKASPTHGLNPVKNVGNASKGIIPQNSEMSSGNAKFSLSTDSEGKNVDNKKPTSNPDIRYSLSEDSKGREISPAVSNRFGNSKVVDENGNLKAVYHGTASGEFTIFDKSKGSVEGDFGSGFYFTDNEFDVSEHYEGGGPDFENKVVRRAEQIEAEEDIDYDEAKERARKELYKGSHKFEVYLNIENPAIVGETMLLTQESYLEQYNEEDYDNYDDYLGDVEQLLADDVENIVWEVERNTGAYSTDGLADVLYNAYYDGGIGIEELKAKINELYLEDDNGNLIGNEVARQVIESLGYDGIIDTTVSGKWNMDMEAGTTHYIVFKPNQIKAVTNQNPTDNPDIHLSLSAEGKASKRSNSRGTYGEDIMLEKAPTQSEVAPVNETISSKMEQVADDFAPMTEEEANALQMERNESLTDEDAPPETEAPYYGESESTMPSDPFEERDIKEVGKRNVKAYMYENPEVKPFFQAEANIMLGDLRNTIKGERWYNDQVYYETNGEAGFGGTSRQTTPEIAYLLDELGYSYAEIEKGLNAIIEDNGAENNACSKRIEFLLNDRLMKGYVDSSLGFEIPANQDYINLINEKQIIEYSEEARKAFFENAEDYAPPVDDIAPVAEAEIAPTTASEAIKPKPETLTGEEAQWAKNKMARADKADTSKGKRRKFVKSSVESEAVDGKILQDDLNQDKIFYQPISNKGTLKDANTRLESMGYEASVAYFNSQFANKKTSVEDIVLGERLIQEAIKRGDNKTAGELIEDVAILGTELGQKVQALSIIKRLTPEGQLRMLRRVVERGKTKGDKAFEGVEITQEMIDKILGVYAKTSDETVQKLQSEIAKLGGVKLTKTDTFYVNGDTYKHRRKLKELGFKWDAEKKAWYLADVSGTFDQAELNKVVEEVKQEIADNMKVTWGEKANAWRYLAMLGNPKTHNRNIVSNIANAGTIAVKNVLARTIESVAPIENRTKTWKAASETVKNFSKQTALEMKDIISGGDKYNETADIKAKRKIFKNKILNGVYEFNNNLLSKEDWWFSKSAFTNSLSEYLTANGISTESDIENNPEILEKAKQYALEQSQIATFRQYSWLANKINGIEKHNAVTNIAVGAVLPFKKTPINIAKTALNYSPLGFAKTLTYDAAQVKKGKMEASTLIDHLAQNVTGSALALVGYLLASVGFINGAGEEDKEGKYDYQLGEQAYSINIGGATFSLSWLSPVAMPLFIGANAYEQLVEGKEWNGDVVVETLAQTLDPLSEMSFLSSLDSVLSSYDSGIEKFAGIGQSMAQNYITQFVPTLSSQFAAVGDDTKRTTKVAGDSDFKFVDETINALKYKIPFLRETLEPSTDIWGNEVKQSENILARAFETFIAPYAKRENITSAVDEEIKALYRETGDDGLIPSIPNNYINYNDEKYEMSAEDFTEYKKTYGQTAFNLLERLFDTQVYQNASSEERADMVNEVYDYARDEAKREYFAKYGVEFTNATSEGVEYYKENTIKGAIESNMMLDEYEFATEYPEKYAFFMENGISYDDYKAADEDGKRAYTWAYENPGKYTLSKAVASDVVQYRKYTSELYDIKADKDENGKSISGSRKEKVADYINNLDADYGEKIILFKSEYPADDTYNHDIIEYLNNREDISYEEMVTILKELGFTVSSDGNVTW